MGAYKQKQSERERERETELHVCMHMCMAIIPDGSRLLNAVRTACVDVSQEQAGFMRQALAELLIQECSTPSLTCTKVQNWGSGPHLSWLKGHLLRNVQTE